MRKTLDTPRGPIHFIGNHVPRPVFSFTEIPVSAREWFDYIEEDEYHDARFFEYLGSWYDLNDGFTADTFDEMRAIGYDGIMSDSYFSATVVKWFDSDGNYMPHYGEIVVGRIHW